MINDKIKHWKSIVTATTIKSICQVVEKQDNKTRVIASDIPDKVLSDLIADLPVQMKIMEDIINSSYNAMKQDYENRGQTEGIHIFKHLDYMKGQIDKFVELYGPLPSIEKKMNEFKPSI